MHWSEEIYWSFLGAVPFMGLYALGGRAYRDPDTFTKTEALTSLGVSSAISYAIGKFVPEFTNFKHYKTLTSGVLAVPVVIASVAAYQYETRVNEPIRELPAHSNSNWFGPFASGFGSVV